MEGKMVGCTVVVGGENIVGNNTIGGRKGMRVRMW